MHRFARSAAVALDAEFRQCCKWHSPQQSVSRGCWRLFLSAAAAPSQVQQTREAAFTAPIDVPTKMVDEILEYVRTQTGSAQRTEILRTGLSNTSPEHGKQRARLLLGLAELESDRNQWDRAVGYAADSFGFLSKEEDSAETAMESFSQHTRACLAVGKDVIAQNSLGQADEVATSCTSYTSSLKAVIRLAKGENHPTMAVDSQTALNSTVLSRPATMYNVGLQHLATGRNGQAQESFVASALASAPARDPAALAGLTRTLLPPLSAAELHAAALAGAGQACQALGNHAQAEEHLSQAVTAAEDVSEERHVRVAPVLLLLAGLYARTQRITLAEGLYRSTAKLLHMDPLHNPHVLSQPFGSHASLGALLAWRYVQLLTTLSKRESEIAAWKQTAKGLVHRGKGGWLDAVDAQLHWHGLEMEDVFGGVEQLQGGDQPGRGFVVDLVSRRAYVKLASIH